MTQPKHTHIYGLDNTVVWPRVFGMKTTVDISDSILIRAKQLAHEKHQTLRSLVEEGLERVIEERARKKKPTVSPVVFSGKGLSPEFKDATWKETRNAAYEGHGA